MNNLNYIFQNLINLIGEKNFEKRNKAHITLVGIGGVGSWAAESLARSGIGRFTLIDLDDICISNSNRQIHTTQTSIGKSKVIIMKNRILDINPYADVNCIHDFLTADNMHLLIKDKTFVLDGIDSLKTKCELISHCLLNNIQIVTTGGAGGKKNPLKIIVKDLNESYNDPLLQRLRKKLRMHYNFPKKKKIEFGIPTVFSPEDTLISSEINCDLTLVGLNEPSKKLNCSNGLGTSVNVVAAFGIIAADHLLSLIDLSD